MSSLRQSQGRGRRNFAYFYPNSTRINRHGHSGALQSYSAIDFFSHHTSIHQDRARYLYVQDYRSSRRAAFLDKWVYPYRIPTHFLIHNGPQFLAKFFTSLCSFFCSHNVTTTAYHPQANGQIKSYNKTLSTRLRHYVTNTRPIRTTSYTR